MLIALPREGDVSRDGLRVRTRLSPQSRMWKGALAGVCATLAVFYATALTMAESLSGISDVDKTTGRTGVDIRREPSS